MPLKTEESRFLLSRNSAGNGSYRLEDSDYVDGNVYGAGHVHGQGGDMEKPCCQTAAAPPEELLTADCRADDSRSFSACATISETARELCKAVSVSLGLATDMDSALPLSAAEDQLSGEYLLRVGAGPRSCPEASKYRCSGQEGRPPPPHCQRQLLDILKSCESASPLQSLTSTRTFAEQKFTVCESDDITSKDIGQRDTTRAASCPYVPTGPDNPGQRFAERPCRAYKPPDEVSEFGEAVENKLGGYQPQYIKSEGISSEPALWGGNYTFNEKYSSQIWGSRQCMTPHSSGANTAFICHPYERSTVRPEQWYPAGGMLRPPYPTSNYIKTEVGEWLDVTYNDSR